MCNDDSYCIQNNMSIRMNIKLDFSRIMSKRAENRFRVLIGSVCKKARCETFRRASASVSMGARGRARGVVVYIFAKSTTDRKCKRRVFVGAYGAFEKRGRLNNVSYTT